MSDQTRLDQLNTFIRACLHLPTLANDEVIREALLRRHDQLLNWYEN